MVIYHHVHASVELAHVQGVGVGIELGVEDHLAKHAHHCDAAHAFGLDRHVALSRVRVEGDIAAVLVHTSGGRRLAHVVHARVVGGLGRL